MLSCACLGEACTMTGRRVCAQELTWQPWLWPGGLQVTTGRVGAALVSRFLPYPLGRRLRTGASHLCGAGKSHKGSPSGRDHSHATGRAGMGLGALRTKQSNLGKKPLSCLLAADATHLGGLDPECAAGTLSILQLESGLQRGVGVGAWAGRGPGADCFLHATLCNPAAGDLGGPSLKHGAACA